MVKTKIYTTYLMSEQELLTAEQRGWLEHAAGYLEKELQALKEFDILVEWRPVYSDGTQTIVSLRVWCDSVEIQNDGYTFEILSDINKLDPVLRADVRRFLSEMIQASLKRLTKLREKLLDTELVGAA